MSAANTPEPPPVANDKPAVWEEVMFDMAGRGGEQLVVPDMRQRDAFGRAKYGTPLQPFNGRDALVDAYQEALDLAVYLKQSLLERYDGMVWAWYETALNTVAGLALIIAARRAP